MTQREKTCPGCQEIKPVGEFVTLEGRPSPRGKFCRPCFLARAQQHVRDLMDGRDYCLYCGRRINSPYAITPEGFVGPPLIEADHMDPISRGGDRGGFDLDGTEDYANLVYCCTACNRRKRGKRFAEWLDELREPHRTEAREFYIARLGRTPEEFESLDPEDAL